ncbi:Retrovirus-related Pol polyprotein from transposon 17.6, partial [Mucuna pruriens]
MNLTILDMVKKEVTKLLATGIIYPISDSQWVSPVQVVPKKSGMTATRKDHFPLPFIDQVLEKLVGKSYYCFLDGFSGYMQIHILPEDQHKTTFTCPFSIIAYTHMPFGLCNKPSTFQCCMTSIFLDLLQECMDVFIDDFMIDIITSLPNPTSVRDVRSFLGHAGFYRRFIKNFSKTTLPLSTLLQKDVEFKFD